MDLEIVRKETFFYNSSGQPCIPSQAVRKIVHYYDYNDKIVSSVIIFCPSGLSTEDQNSD